MKGIVRIIIADDHIIFREGLKNVLQSKGNYKVVGEACNGNELLIQLSKSEADVVFIDIKMPIIDGIEATKQIRSTNSKICILALSMFDNIELFNQMIQAGANGFLLKNATLEQLEEAIKCAMQGNFYCSEEFIHSSPNHYATKSKINLSEREKEVLRLICEGLSSAEIAKRLHLSNFTIEGHRKSLLIKTEMNNTASLVTFAIRNNFVQFNK